MTKTLIIPDIHCEFAWAEEIIKKENPDLTIFLGDYFDRYDSDPNIPQQVAEWLKKSLEYPKRIHLFGNHELWYAGHHQICSGNTELKKLIINRVGIPWRKLKIHYWMDDYLITHAGLSKTFYDKYKTQVELKLWLDSESSIAKDNLLGGSGHTFFDIGETRGGWEDVGGIFWCDIREFEPIKGLKQIFGHSHMERPWERFSDNWCLDADQYYALYEDKKLKVKKYD